MKQDTLERLASLADHGGERRAAWQEAAELIRRAGDYRWVGLYQVTDTEINAIAWTGTIAPAFPRFPRDKGLNGVAVNTRHAVISQDVANDPPEQIFWVVKNGINMTGMPSFGSIGVGDDDIWKIVAFIKQLPHVSEADYKSWTAGSAPAAATKQ